MVLSDKDIHLLLRDGELVVLGTDPAHPFIAVDQVQPCSIDLRLGNRFLCFKPGIVEFDIRNIADVSALMEERIVADKEKIVLPPKGILFGQIYEQLRLPPMCCGYIEGRSRFARLGLSVHVTGGFINPEFEGAMPLQIVNSNSFPITIYPYITICQLLLNRLSAAPLIPYPRRSNNPYHKESNASPSTIGRDPELSSESRFLPNLNRVIETRLLANYLNGLNAEDEKRRMIDAIKESSLDERGATTINVKDSTVGLINTGVASNIDASVKTLVQRGNVDLAEAISQFTLAIQSSSLEKKQADEALEVLSAIASEARKPVESRRTGVIKALLSQFEMIVKLFDGAGKLWDQWGSVLLSLIGS
jgi:dCTP deaminase